MKYLQFITLLLLCVCSPLWAQTTTAEKKEFSDGSYLQIDQLDVPKGIKRVEEQLRENVIDVILHSKVHSPIFAQKRPEGYSKDYKKFYGLNIRILPIIGDEDFYSLQLFYYNWTTNKFDKKLVKKISRYNVLNELRFATYEIILGKQWVLDHKDQIESRNFERIQAVREVLADNEKRRKKQQKEDQRKKEIEEEENQRKSARNLIKREEREKKQKKEDPEQNESPENESAGAKSTDSVSAADPDIEKISLEENQQKSGNSGAKSNKKSKSSIVPENEAVSEATASVFPEGGPPAIPKKTYLYGFANYFQEGVDIGGIISTSTSLKYLGAGGKFILERQTTYPTGARFSIQAATPIFKEKYKFPIYRGVESEYYIKLLGHMKFFGGLDFVPVYFVGLPEEGARFQVYENDFLWAKAGMELNGNIFEKDVELRVAYMKSLVSKSNQKGTFDASKMSLSLYSQIKNNHGAEINFSTMNANGAFNVTSQKIALSYIYKFEN